MACGGDHWVLRISLHLAPCEQGQSSSVASGGVSPTDTEHARYHHNSWFVTLLDSMGGSGDSGPAHLFLTPAEDSKEGSIL